MREKVLITFIDDKHVEGFLTARVEWGIEIRTSVGSEERTIFYPWTFIKRVEYMGSEKDS